MISLVRLGWVKNYGGVLNNMYRNSSDAIPIKMNITLFGGGLGDCIAKMPAIRYLLKNYKHVTADLFVPDYFKELADYWLGQEPMITVKTFSNMAAECNYELPALVTHNPVATTLRTHLVDNAFNTLIDTPAPKDLREREYYKIEGAPSTDYGDYIVITTNYTADVRQFKPETINEIVRWAAGKGLKTVFLGNTLSVTGNTSEPKIASKTSRVELEKGINLLNQTTLLEAAKIMGRAKAVVGVDNGLLHLACCTNTWVVGGFTSVHPDTRVPYRKGVQGYKYLTVTPDAGLGCKFCQTNMQFRYMHDFRTCVYKDYQCLDELTAKKFIDKLELII